MLSEERGGTVAGRSAWAASEPAFTNVLADDLDSLAKYVEEGARRLLRLSEPVRRSPSESDEASEIKSLVARARGRFLRLHAESVYRSVTHNLTRRLRLDALIESVTSAFPGILPSSAQMSRDLTQMLRDREGHEIDLGAFAQAILRRPEPGKHLLETMLRPTERAQSLHSDFRKKGSVTLDSARLERRARAAFVTMENAASLNAEDVQLMRDLETAVDLVAMDPEIKVGVLRGGEMTHPKYAGKRVFCAGINLKAFARGEIPLIDFLLTREMGLVNKLRHGVLLGEAEAAGDAVQKPWLAVVDSFAIGGGMQLLLNFDKVIAERNSYFSLPAANEGIIPGLGNLRLPYYAGGRLTRQIILFGRRIHATDPEAALICDEVVEARELDAAIDRAVAALECEAVASNRRMISLAEESLDRAREYLAEFAYQQALRMYSPDVLSRVDRRPGHDG